MARGRHQYYDPILQVPSTSEGAPNLERIELFPAGQESEARLPDQIGKWIARRIDPEGRVAEESSGDFDHDRALAQAQQMWPGLPVYELNAEIDDSTWEGVGPSPRLWHGAQGASVEPLRLQPIEEQPQPNLTPAGEEFSRPQMIRVMQAALAGNYILAEDVITLLEGYAQQYDQENNPSASMGLREAAAALRSAF